MKSSEFKKKDNMTVMIINLSNLRKALMKTTEIQ